MIILKLSIKLNKMDALELIELKIKQIKSDINEINELYDYHINDKIKSSLYNTWLIERNAQVLILNELKSKLK